MDTIRLTLTKQLEETLAFLEERYKPLSRAELIKMGLSELYQKATYTQTSTKENLTYEDLSRKELLRQASYVFDIREDDGEEDIIDYTKAKPFNPKEYE